MEKTYNGWTNYATWRVNLEMFDGMTAGDLSSFSRYAPENSIYDCAEELKAIATEAVSGNDLATDYALAFMDDVNWREIAQHMVDDYMREYLDETESEV